MSSVVDAYSGAASSIGRYFNVVSSMPALLFVTYMVALARSGAWSASDINFDRIFAQDPLATAALIALLTFLTAVSLHPLSFLLIRIYEGYWGTSGFWADLATLRILHHKRLIDFLNSQHAHQKAPREPDEAGAVRARFYGMETQRRLAGYPAEHELLPTRLGNAMRRHERRAGRAYGLEAPEAVPRISLVADPRHLDYVQDQRLSLELTLRVSFLSTIAAIATVVAMFSHGVWVLLALFPYCVAWLSYRGAVVTAGNYGHSLEMLVDMNRFRLYERMRLPIPSSTDKEQIQNKKLSRLLRQEPDVYLDYTTPASPDSDDAPKK